jgi:hypothetical protein
VHNLSWNIIKRIGIKAAESSELELISSAPGVQSTEGDNDSMSVSEEVNPFESNEGSRDSYESMNNEVPSDIEQRFDDFAPLN